MHTILRGGAYALALIGTMSPISAAERAMSRTIEEVVVTAQKREQSLSDLGIAVTTLNEEELRRQGFTDISDLAVLVPGFSYTDSGLNVPIYTLRGVGFNESSLAATSTVSVYVDEIPLPFPITTKGAALDLQRVEVVKGPQGTLYGENTTGGAINYITNRPTDTLSSRISLGYGRFNEQTFEGHVSGPVNERVRARLAARMNRGDGWQESLTRSESAGDVDRNAARFLLDWDISDSVQMSLNLNGWTDKGETFVPQVSEITPVVPANASPELLASPVPSSGDIRHVDWNPELDLSRDDRFGQASVRLDWGISEALEATSLTAYSYMDTHANSETDGTAVTNSSYETEGEIRSFFQEFRLSGSVPNLVEWVLGLNYSQNDTKSYNLITTQGTATEGTGIETANQFDEQDMRSASVFVSGDWFLTDTLSLTTGVRYSDSVTDFYGCSGDSGDNSFAPFNQFVSDSVRAAKGLPPLPDEFFLPGPAPQGCTVFINDDAVPGLIDTKLEEDNVSWRTALEWSPLDGTLVYASASQGFKSGSYPQLPASTYVQYFPVTQEELLAYEVGVKATLLEQTLRMNMSAFYYDYQDKQLRGIIVDPVYAFLPTLVNVPESHVTGVEYDALWLPVNGLSLSASVSYLTTEIDKYIGLTAVGETRDFSGAEFNYSPEWQYNLAVSYEWNVGSELTAFVASDYAYRSSTSAVFEDDPSLEIDSYGLLGARVGVSSTEGWEVMLFGDNLTNEHHYNNARRGDTITRYVSKPATYGIRFSMAFGQQ